MVTDGGDGISPRVRGIHEKMETEMEQKSVQI